MPPRAKCSWTSMIRRLTCYRAVKLSTRSAQKTGRLRQCHYGISQNGRKAQQNGPVAHLTDGNKRETRTISSHHTVIRKAHRLVGQKFDLRYPWAFFPVSPSPVLPLDTEKTDSI